MPQIRRKNHTSQALVVVAVLFLTGIILAYMGRTIICTCGYIKVWEGDIWSAGNSQHLSDWYTFSHIIHGFIFYYLFTRFARKLPPWAQLLGALLIEAGWEILENSPIIINRYRAATSSVDYYGDSIVNSLSDILSMVGGYALAKRLPTWVIITSGILMEIATTYLIRDGLILNIIMLIHPIESIKNWQMALSPFFH